MTVTRPALRYFGGKWTYAPWIISHFPHHKIYVEAFGGGASVLLQKGRSYAEVYNDLNQEVVNFFRVLRDRKKAGEFLRLLELTPFSRDEYYGAFEPAECEIESARRMVVRAFQSFGSDGIMNGKGTSFRAVSRTTGTSAAFDWKNLKPAYPAIIKRLEGVTIENRNAVEVIQQQDSEHTLHYLDPPYLPETRSDGGYRHEMTFDDHKELLELALRVEGMVIISGYGSALYEDALKDWRKVERKAYTLGAQERTECLWISPKADIPDLFSLENAA